MTATILKFPKPPVPPIRCIDPVDEMLALSELARLRAEKAGQNLERDCDRALVEIEDMIANIEKLKELMR